MKRQTKKASFLLAAFLATLFMTQPVVASAQGIFSLGNINIEQEFQPIKLVEAAGEVLATSTEEPSVPVEKPTEPKPIVITVAKGDTLSKIAKAHSTEWKRLFDANAFIADPNIINPGEQIRIPFADEVIPERALPTPKPAAKISQTKRKAATGTNTGASAPAVASGGVWDALARCESGGNWAINTGNGYYGGLQFNASTWLSNGGGQYAPYAHLATREQQIDIASRLHAARGFKPWPACARKLGLL